MNRLVSHPNHVLTDDSPLALQYQIIICLSWCCTDIISLCIEEYYRCFWMSVAFLSRLSCLLVILITELNNTKRLFKTSGVRQSEQRILRIGYIS